MIKDETYFRTMSYLNTPPDRLLIHTRRNGEWTDVDIIEATDEELDIFVTVYPKLTAQWTIILARHIRDQANHHEKIDS